MNDDDDLIYDDGDDDYNDPADDPDWVCKGRVYRGYSKTFIKDDGSIESKVGLRPLKRKSCKGCRYCGFIDEDIREELGTFPYIGKNPGFQLYDIAHNALYEITIQGEGPDHNGEYDSWLSIDKVDGDK